jgi:hypothetical protein
MSKLLLKEFNNLCPDGVCCIGLLTEEEKKMKESGVMLLTGILQSADKKNGNGRIYRRSILEREVDNYQKAIRENRALGELDHCDDAVINLKNVSHMVMRVFWDNNDVKGVVKVLNTPSGKILQSLIHDEVNIGISSRGLGSIKETREGVLVEDDFQLICFDVVSEPSTENAYLHLQENKTPERKLYNKADRIFRSLNDIVRGKK